MAAVIAGSFNPARQPIVGSRLVVPRLGVDDWVDFLVDTGADSTCLHPADGQYIQFPYDELNVSLDSEGVGGSYPYYREYAFVVFYDSDNNQARAFDIILAVARPEQPTPSNPRPVVNRLPSLLGRDVLNRLRMDYDFPGGRLEFFAG